MKLWTYKRSFKIDDIEGVVHTIVTFKDTVSVLFIGGVEVARDRFAPIPGMQVFRNNHLSHRLSDGRTLDIEAGYVGWWKTEIAVRVNGILQYESKPGAKIQYPASMGKTLDRNEELTPEQVEKQKRDEQAAKERFQRNLPSIIVDIAIGLLFFVVAKLTNLTTAALVSAAAGIVIWIVQRFVKIDLMGGLAAFGIIMSLIAAGFAWAFQDDDMVKMRSTILGLLTASLFLTDGVFNGRYLGKRLARYMPHPNTDAGRLSLGIGSLGVVMAVLNYVMAKLFSTDVWLVYSTFLDTIITIGLVFFVIRWATPKAEAQVMQKE
jgi:intracellular septation protein A